MIVFSLCTQDFRHKIVGFEEKIIRIFPNQTYYYSDYSQRFVNLKESTKSTHAAFQKTKRIQKFDGYGILNSFFIHKAYLEMFFDPLMLPDGALKYVERLQNCESILMNVVVTKFLGDTRWDQNGPLAVKNTSAIEHVDVEETGIERYIN